MHYLIKILLITALLVLFIACSSKSEYVQTSLQPKLNSNSNIMENQKTNMNVISKTSTPISTRTIVNKVLPTPTVVPPTPTVVPIDTNIKLKNFLIKNLGPYDSKASKFGDIKFDPRFSSFVFSEFGRLDNRGQSAENYNATFKFRAPSDTKLISPIKGVVSFVEWQSRASDWEIHIKPTLESDWILGIDHIASIDCEPSALPTKVCDKQLTINGEILKIGMVVNENDVLGYVGSWSDYGNIGIYGLTELMVFKYLDDFQGVMNYCPTLYLAEEVQNELSATIFELMKSYEQWTETDSIYDQTKMIAPGCIYKAIKEINGKIELID